MDLLSSTPSLLRTQLSGVAGSVSLACWLVLLLPQLIEQWRLKSAEGISPLFLILWTLGDILNLVGALWAGLLPQVVLLAAWFTFADGFTLAFYYYFTYIYPKRLSQEQAPLLGQTSRRKSSTLDDVVLQPQNHSIFVKYILPLLAVFAAGFIGFLCSSPPKEQPDTEMALGAQICGYLSALLYLSARLPQIAQNYTKKSCKGLSLLFFMLSTFGNITYGLQILFYRSDWDYIVLNSSWLLGSLGTILEDAVIFVQFYMYRDPAAVFD
ncbi:hypothetical protein OGAPHI_001224 [Ogataea philodendri]|uniref:Uncharacterized protein n=1 Tax=Ogataea philodendri TaxID=1378263 RepID=A0A9P8PG95_9ASCO|nr:uncharacterized protein OGAPHI_001224 [Ogataea philodendri]KAH3670709.1 hypothetical protein OGAPHI_001224 [Ogataea philodendri]